MEVSHYDLSGVDLAPAEKEEKASQAPPPYGLIALGVIAVLAAAGYYVWKKRGRKIV